MKNSVKAFLGEAEAPGAAVVSVNVTGTPQAVQKAIAQLAKKKGGIKGKAFGGAPAAPELDAGPDAGDKGDKPGKSPFGGKKPSFGGKKPSFGKKPADDDDKAPKDAEGVVEALIRERQ